jgi:hypothetical protein
VRFVRHNAARDGIRADRIGAAGSSSGGHLVSMLGTLDGKGNASDPDPVERQSAKVQCVVVRSVADGELLSSLIRTRLRAADRMRFGSLGPLGAGGACASTETSEKRTVSDAAPRDGEYA